MYLTAHLVRSNDRREGINAFLHEHGPGFPWPADSSSLPDTEPGITVRQRTDLSPGGNAVRAYLDLLAPDGTPPAAFARALTAFSQDLLERRNPTVFRHEAVTIRFGVELSLEALRAEQLEMLARCAMQLLDDHAQAGDNAR